MFVGGCGKVGRENGAMECPNGWTHNGTYNDVILEKGESSRAVKSYADVTREDVKTQLGKNRLILPYLINFIKVYLHGVTLGPC